MLKFTYATRIHGTFVRFYESFHDIAYYMRSVFGNTLKGKQYNYSIVVTAFSPVLF